MPNVGEVCSAYGALVPYGPYPKVPNEEDEKSRDIFLPSSMEVLDIKQFKMDG